MKSILLLVGNITPAITPNQDLEIHVSAGLRESVRVNLFIDDEPCQSITVPHNPSETHKLRMLTFKQAFKSKAGDSHAIRVTITTPEGGIAGDTISRLVKVFETQDQVDELLSKQRLEKKQKVITCLKELYLKAPPFGPGVYLNARAESSNEFVASYSEAGIAPIEIKATTAEELVEKLYKIAPNYFNF